MGRRHRSGRQRLARRNRPLIQLVLGHFAAVVAEWAAVIGVLVYAFDRGGTTATGFASVALLAAGLSVAPFAGWLVDRHRPQRVRLIGLSIQFAGYGGAALAAAADLPVAVVVGSSMIALGAVTTLRPSGAVLIPAHVRSTEELVIGNLWFWYCESFSVLGGPLLATGLLEVGGAAAVMTGCTVASLIAVVLTVLDLANDPPARIADGRDDARQKRQLLGAWHDLRGRPGLMGVLAVVWGQYVMIGALDLLLVVVARSSLDLGDSGPGLLSTLFGVGALFSLVLATRLLRRVKLAPTLALVLLLVGVAFATLGLALSVVAAVVVLPVLGLCRSLIDGPSRMLLQRSAGPDALGSLFAIREVCSSTGLIVGSLFVQLMLAIGDPEQALVALGGFFVVLLAIVWRSLRMADADADVPVMEMSLLRRLPIFAPLPPVSLEALARSATPVRVEAGTVVITQGEPGDRFYAVVDGAFDVTMSGNHIRTAARLGFFGEVALLADIPRTATVTASTAGRLLAIDRVAFLLAVTGTDSSRQAAWGVVHGLTFDGDVPFEK